MNDGEWCRDPAALGLGSRWHTWLGGYELIAYDDGRWEVRGLYSAAHASNVFAGGVEGSAEGARERAVKVHAALTVPLTYQALLDELVAALRVVGMDSWLVPLRANSFDEVCAFAARLTSEARAVLSADLRARLGLEGS